MKIFWIKWFYSFHFQCLEAIEKQFVSLMLIIPFFKVDLKLTTKYFIGHVTLFFANNYLTEYWINIEYLHNFFHTLT